MKKHSIYLVGLAALVGSLVAMALGFVPRSFAFIIFLVQAALLIGVSLPQAAVWFLVFVPWSFALPISEGLDTLGIWRILALILALRWLKVAGLKGLKTAVRQAPRLLKWALIAAMAWLGWAGLGILMARSPWVLGLKQLLFSANALVLLPLYADLFKKHEIVRNQLITAGYRSLGAALLVGLFQQVAVFFVSLADFWQWWAAQVVPIFSGWATGTLLTFSNTWFSYWPGDLATLRSFGVFPDSHSYALAAILWLILATAHWANNSQPRRWPGRLAVFMGLLFVVLSGTRGAWVSAILLLIIWLWGLLKTGTVMSRLRNVAGPALILFVLALPIGSAIWGGSLAAELARTGRATDLSFLSLIRARSIFDFDETSNKGRLEIWRGSVAGVLKSPVFGVGLGNFPSVLNESLNRSRAGSSAHSLYLQYAVETGLVGLLMMLMFGGAILAHAFKTARSSVAGTALYGGATAIYFIWLFGYSVVDVVLLNDRLLALFMVLAGWLFSFHVNSKPTQGASK